MNGVCKCPLNRRRKELYGSLFLSVSFHSDSSIHYSVENVLSLNQELTLGCMNLLLDVF